MVFINSRGEALVHNRIQDIISFIHAKGTAVRLLSNGYLLGQAPYMGIADCCEEVIGELKVTTDEDFQRLQRPVDGFTLNRYICNMVAFRRQYEGHFIFEITILRGYNDDPDSLVKLKRTIAQLKPYRVSLITMEDEPFVKKLALTEEKLQSIKDYLLT